MSSKLIMLGARVPESARDRIKLIARALGKTDAEALAHMIENYEGTPALQKAIKALQEADRLVEAARKSK